MSNSTEVAYNLALARLLRHEGLNAQGEQRHIFGQARGQADVLLDFDDYAVVIEAEFGAPAKADADKRFPPDQPAMVGGLPLRLAVAVGYPERLADLPESDTDSNLAAATDLGISYRYYGDEWGAVTVGTVASLAEQLRNYWVQSDNGARIEEIVQKASTAIDQVAEVLARLDRDRGREPGVSRHQGAHMAQRPRQWAKGQWRSLQPGHALLLAGSLSRDQLPQFPAQPPRPPADPGHLVPPQQLQRGFVPGEVIRQ